MNFMEQVIKETEARYSQQEKTRESRFENWAKGNWTKVEDPRRIRFRMERLGMTEAIAEVMEDMGDAEGKPTVNVFERILAESQLTNVYFLLKGAFVSKSVCRIVIRSSMGRIMGFGTGFMVSPSLMMTNNHVLKNSNSADSCTVQFNFQEDFGGVRLDTEEFALEPATFFLTNKDLDFTLVAIKPTNGTGKKVRDFGWNPLLGQSGKALFNDRVNIIQHPGGKRKQVALRENRIIGVPKDFLHYKTDTMPGSSGSPVFNEQWEVAALHHSGVPERRNGRIVLTDGRLWDGREETVHLIKWVANEGVRISSIVKHVRSLNLSIAEEKLFEESLTLFPEMNEKTLLGEMPGLLESPDSPEPVEQGNVPKFESDGTLSWYFKLNFGQVNGIAPSPPVSPAGPPLAAAPQGHFPPPAGDDDVEDTEEEAVSIDPDYSNRKGYDPLFLGKNEKSVPLPALTDSMMKNVALNQEAEGDERFFLPYHHYSVVMNGKRKLAYLVAVNINGKSFRPITRERDRWFFDPRIKPTEQVGNRLYKHNPLDRGHLVRRQDPCWGGSFSIAKKANDDTFHYTNCAPQHEGLNRSNSMWLGLEDYILDNATKKDFKVSVFSGPVFRDDDRFYRGVQIPEEFWKVAVMVKDDDTLSTTAYLLSQNEMIADLEEEFALGAFKTFQVQVSKIESLTGLDFGHIKKFDPLLLNESSAGIEIFSLEDISL